MQQSKAKSLRVILKFLLLVMGVVLWINPRVLYIQGYYLHALELPNKMAVDNYCSRFKSYPINKNEISKYYPFPQFLAAQNGKMFRYTFLNRSFVISFDSSTGAVVGGIPLYEAENLGQIAPK